MSPRLRSAYLQRIEDRLAENDDELARVRRMSEAELELMVKMERGWGPVAA